MPEQVVYRRSPEVVAANLGEKSFLLHVREWVYLELNDTGSRIWELLEEGQTADTLTRKLTVEFDIDAQTCAGDTTEFLQTLAGRQFVIPVPS